MFKIKKLCRFFLIGHGESYPENVLTLIWVSQHFWQQIWKLKMGLFMVTKKKSVKGQLSTYNK